MKLYLEGFGRRLRSYTLFRTVRVSRCLHSQSFSTRDAGTSLPRKARLLRQRRGVPDLDGFNDGGAGWRKCGHEPVSIGRKGNCFDDPLAFERQQSSAGFQTQERQLALGIKGRGGRPLSQDETTAVGTDCHSIDAVGRG